VFVGLIVSMLGLAVAGSPVSAHTSFVGSDPANGSTVSAPVSEIVIEFTNPSEVAGDGFVVLGPDGVVLDPAVTSADGTSYTLSFDEPLTGGVIGVRWSVRAGDAHPIDGSFSFTIDANAVAVAGAAPVTNSGDMSSMTAEEMAAMGSGDMSSMSAEEMAAMDDFLQVDQSRPGETTATLGRLISIAAIVLAIGALAFAATTLRGTRFEIETLITAVRVLGFVIAAGAVIEYFGVARIAGDSLASAWSSSPGMATGSRAVAGLAIALGVVATTTVVRPARRARSLSSAVNTSFGDPLDADFWDEVAVGPAVDQRSAPLPVEDSDRSAANGAFNDPGLTLTRQLSNGRSASNRGGQSHRTFARSARRQPNQHNAKVAVETSHELRTDRIEVETVGVSEAPAPAVRQWSPDRSSWLAFVGVALAVASFWFDGHTVSEGFRPVHALANSVHVVAGSVWVGGVVAMAAVIWLRHRRDHPSGALELVVRFSSVASVALGAVVVAGLIMAVSILDSFGELTSTEWGQTLLLKTAAAGIAMLAGAYNHFRLMPALERHPDDAELHRTVRSVVTAEAIMLGFVVVVTAWLVAAAT
jgi:copper transport protein